MILALMLAGSPAAAICVTGAKCVTVPEAQKTPPKWQAGDVLEPGSFKMIMNATFFGLPASDDTFWYVEIDRRALKIDPVTYEVIADVTDQTNRSF